MKIIINSLFIYFLMFATNVFAGEKQVVISVDEEWSKSLDILKILLKDSYNEIGYEVVFKDLPAARGLKELKHGKVDGDMARTINIAVAYDAIMIYPSYFSLKINAYYLKSKFKTPPAIDEIKKGKVAHVNGSLSIDKFLINADSVIVNNQALLINLLKLNRVDYIVPSSPLVYEDEKMGKILLFELPIFHILSKKNIELSKILEPVFKKNIAKPKYSHLQEQINKIIYEK